MGIDNIELNNLIINHIHHRKQGEKIDTKIKFNLSDYRLSKNIVLTQPTPKLAVIISFVSSPKPK